MATIIKPDGSEIVVNPKSGKTFSLSELQKLVGGLIQIVALADGRQMIVDEEAMYKEYEVNDKASELYYAAGGIPGMPVKGTAVIAHMDEIE